MDKILITGVTGFVGGATLENIINNKLNCDLLLLVRADSYGDAINRVHENMRKFNVSGSKLSKITESNILLGDLGKPDVYLEDPRLDSITHVINCAAITSFGKNPMIWKVNVDGTLALARRMAKVKGLKRFLHVGTAMSCTPEPNTLVSEDSHLIESKDHFVEYTHSKLIVEKLMRKHCPEMPLLFARPSIVVGHTKYGCKPSSSIFWVFSMGLMLQRFMCSMKDRIDVIPVDYCAEAIIMLLNSDLPNGEIVHISAGEEHCVQFKEIDNAIADAMQRQPVGDKYAKVSYDVLLTMRRDLKKIFGPCNERIMLKAMYLYGQFAELNVRFDNHKLLSLGMPKPPRFTDYIGLCVNSTRHLSIPQQMMVDFK